MGDWLLLLRDCSGLGREQAGHALPGSEIPRDWKGQREKAVPLSLVRLFSRESISGWGS